MDMSVFPKAAELASVGARAPRWRPGLARSGAAALHSEIFASSGEAGGAAFALALALDDLPGREAAGLDERSVLWVQDEASRRLAGRPYQPGLPRELRRRVIHVAARHAQDALFALEEGLRCRDLLCVIGEIAGNPKALDFTASRRLSLTAEKHGVPLFLVRLDAARDLSSARMRWQVRSAASSVPRWNRDAPGSPAWNAELFRARAHAPGEWVLRDEDGQLRAVPPRLPAGAKEGKADTRDAASPGPFLEARG